MFSEYLSAFNILIYHEISIEYLKRNSDEIFYCFIRFHFLLCP